MLEMAAPLSGANTTVGLTTISDLALPVREPESDAELRRSPPAATGYTGQFAVSNYAGNYGGPAMIKACSGTIVPNKVKNNLVFNQITQSGGTPPATAGPIRMQTIIDGMSTTALFSEHLLANDNLQSPSPSPVTPGDVTGKRGLFPVAINVVLDQASTSQRPGLPHRLQGPPGDDQGDVRRQLRDPVAPELRLRDREQRLHAFHAAQQHLLRGHPGRVHLHLERDLGRDRRGDHGDEQPSRGRPRRLRRRLGEVRQGLGRRRRPGGPSGPAPARRSSAAMRTDAAARPRSTGPGVAAGMTHGIAKA